MELPAGLTFLDHTADVGIALEAPSLDALFHRAALGMLALLRGQEDTPALDPARAPAPSGSAGSAPEAAPNSNWVSVWVSGAGRAEVLLGWLRELLFLHETERRDYVGSAFERLDGSELRARVRTEPASGAVREIKGVTYHGLEVERDGSGWRARVIFDV